MAEIHLVCNAHIDPVWQWDWNEGAAVALSTFRAAADFCEEFGCFAFCHNEAMLYQWIEEYDPPLFDRIRRLVASGKWHIMGGWYLQPDCNLPSGESILRQIELGKEYFYSRFGIECSAAVSFDAFGHDRGLVQILKQTGYTAYLFMRPDRSVFDYPSDAFRWSGYDGSQIMAWHVDCGYHSDPGTARKKIEKWLSQHPDTDLALIPWGVGNHGGGPSREDIRNVDQMIREHTEHRILHSSPESFFHRLSGRRDQLPVLASSLRPFAVGCYTSQIRVKQRHRHLEAMLDRAARLAADASFRCGLAWPAEEFRSAEEDLCRAEFHDILPGSGIRDAEEYALRIMNHGLEILDRIETKAFFALSAGEKKAAPGETAVLVYNPYPYTLATDIDTEFMLEDAEERHGYFEVTVRKDQTVLPSQVTKERSNMAWEWRKRVTFHAILPPMQISRFDASVTNVPSAPVINPSGFVFDNGHLHAELDPSAGLLTSYRIDGTEYLSAPAGELVMFGDSPDSWGMTVDRFSDRLGSFRLMTAEESARFAGTGEAALPPVRVTEDGPVCRIAEACFIRESSTALIVWRFPKHGTEIEVTLRIHPAERNIAVKWLLPTRMKEEYLGQGMFGWDHLIPDGRENVAQSWIAAGQSGYLLTLINDGPSGSSCEHGILYQTLLRTCGYAAHPRGEAPVLRRGRWSEAQEQGERIFRFRLNAGPRDERLRNITKEAMIFAAPPYSLSCFPDGNGVPDFAPLVRLRSDSVVMTRLEPYPHRPGFLRVRLHESAGIRSEAVLLFPGSNNPYLLSLDPFEFRTLICDPRTGCVHAVPPVDIGQSSKSEVDSL